MGSKQDLLPAQLNRSAFQRSLLRWYERHRRDLPWRRTNDPYRIWVSEIMLQQTRVAAVLEHYRLFLKQFPNIRALAAASESAVLAAWSGLGYYRRARMMRLCAQEIVRDHNSRFPKSSAELQSLPGIGRYTAAAIASISFAEPIAVVDGNVERVLERLVGRELTVKEIWDEAQSLLTPLRPADHNQAMMELGATICIPRGPNCLACPVKKWCATNQSHARTSEMERRLSSAGSEAVSEPVMERRASSSSLLGVVVRNPKSPNRQTKKEIWCALCQRDGHVQLLQRAKNVSLMPGMWEFPQWAQAEETERRPPVLSGVNGSSPDGVQSWRTFRHSITTTDYTVHVVRAKGAKIPDAEWIAVRRISAMPITGLTRKILKAAGII